MSKYVQNSIILILLIVDCYKLIKELFQKVISNALGDGITSATAAVIPRSLPKPKSESSTKPLIKHENTSVSINDKRPTLHLHNLGTEHRGLWGQSIVEIDAEIEGDKISPVYEEPTDFATTIARLRNVLQQKSTVNTPLWVLIFFNFNK